MMTRASAFMACLLSAYHGVTVIAAPPDYQRDIQPIFAEHCAQCHGVDAADRQSGLRLDLRDAALRGGESGNRPSFPAIWIRVN